MGVTALVLQFLVHTRLVDAAELSAVTSVDRSSDGRRVAVVGKR